ncbi:MAG TPA: DUF3566 domain-containing protein [Jatrophihabitans sp.]|nr:DUF3566 domain-containing protein [Jatrophihabitans sp.]
MTQSAQGGHTAPTTAPSPSTPTNSTPWGSTSTSAGTAPGATTVSNGPAWSSTPISDDAPTASVPLVQGTGSDGRGSSNGSNSRSSRQRGPRRARLQLRHVNPWTVLKFSCVLSIALFFVWLIVVGVLFGVLDGAGVIGKINNAYTTIQGTNSKPPVTASLVFGGAAIIGVVNIVLFIALSTIGSVVYNLCADLVGGIEITLSER